MADTSWRETASKQTQDDLDSMLGECISVAFKMLSKEREFYPFALTTSKDNKKTLVGTHQGEEYPLSEDVIADLKKILIQTRDGIKVAAIVDDIKVDGKYDAIRTIMEHREGLAFEIIVPYSISGILKKVKLGTERSTASHIEKFVWQ